MVVELSLIDGTDFLNGLEPSRSLLVLVSLTPTLLCRRSTLARVLSVLTRASRPACRPIVLPLALPTVLREESLGPRFAALEFRPSRMLLRVDRLAALSEPIGRPIRDGGSVFDERVPFAAGFLPFLETDGRFLPITLPIFRLRTFRSDVRLLLCLDEAERLLSLTGRLPAELPDGLVVFILPPIRDVMLGLILFLLFKLFLSEVEELFTRSLIELRLLEVLLPKESLGRPDVVLLLRKEFPGFIELPIREVMLELIRPFELLRRDEFVLPRLNVLEFGAFDRLVIDLLVTLLLGVRLVIDLFVTLLLGVRLVIDLLVTLLLGERLVIDLLVTPLLGVRLVMDRLDIPLFDDRLVMDLLVMLLLGVRFVMDLLVMLLLGVRLVIDLLVVFLLGERFVIDLLVTLLLGVRLVMDRLDIPLFDDLPVMDLLVTLLLGVRLVMLLLGVRLVIDRLDELLLEILLLGVLLIVGRLELRLDVILLERLEELALGAALGAGAGLETLRLERFDLPELRAERDDFAAKTGSQNSKSANNKQKTRNPALICFDCPAAVACCNVILCLKPNCQPNRVK